MVGQTAAGHSQDMLEMPGAKEELPTELFTEHKVRGESLLWWKKGRGLTTAHQGSDSCTRKEIRTVGIRRV